MFKKISVIDRETRHFSMTTKTIKKRIADKVPTIFRNIMRKVKRVFINPISFKVNLCIVSLGRSIYEIPSNPSSIFNTLINTHTGKFKETEIVFFKRKTFRLFRFSSWA